LLPAQKSWTIGQADIGGPFTLIDHNGQKVTEQSYAGEHLLVFFGFTFCPDICPAALQKVTAVLDQLGDKAKRLRVLFISVDPQRDTPEQLKLYMSNFHSRAVGLTGSPEQIAAAAKAYRIYYRKVEDASNPDGYTMDHSGFIYLMDERGKFITHFTHITPLDKIAERLQQEL
jgi:protein SCO1/2